MHYDAYEASCQLILIGTLCAYLVLMFAPLFTYVD